MKHYRVHDDEFVFIRKNGSNEDDIFIGGNRNETYNGRGGNDTLHGGWGNDRLNGGTGNDGVYGQGGNDRLSGGPGDDYVAGDVGRDVVSGGSGSDTFAYTANGPFLLGGSGIDRITDFDPRGADHDLLIMLINYNFGVNDFAALRRGMRMDHGDTVMNFGNGDVLILENVKISQLQADDFLIFGG